MILAFRFFYGFRVIGPFALGMSRVPAWRFVILNAIGAAIWATALSVAGYMLGRAAEALIADLERYEFAGHGGDRRGRPVCLASALVLHALADRGVRGYEARC